MFHLSPSNIVISVIILLVSCSFGIYKIIFLLLLLFVCLCGLLSSAMVTEKSSSYNIGHHNQDHSVGVPQLLEEMEGQTSKQRIQHYIGDFKDINDVLQEMLDLTYRDYMKPWHQVIKNDNSLQISISNSITHVFKALSYRASQVDLVPYLTTRLVDDFATHIRLYRGSLNHIKEHGPHKDIEEVFFDMEKQMDGKRSREVVCCNNKALNQYLRELTGVLLFLLLPPEDFNNNILTYLLREVLLSTVLTPTLDYITDPDNINYYMALPCRDETFTHECFLSILRSSKSIEELLAVKEKVEEDIAKQRSQDSGGEDDTLIKQRLSSLLFLQSTVLSLINNIRTGDDKKSPSTPDPRGNNFTFDDLLNDHKALTYFIDFLTSKDMQHYLFFYLTVESYKVSAEQQISASLLTTAGPHQVDMDTLYEAAFSIFNQYLSDKASPCIKLDSMLVDIVMSRIKHGDAMESIFDDVQAKVYEAMQDDPSCFPSFKLSPYFNKLINQLQPSLLSDNDPGFVNDGGDINRNNNKNSNKDFYDGVDPNEGIINGYGEDLKGDNNDTTMTTTTNKNKNVKKTTFTSGNENKEDDCSVIPGIFVIDEEEHNIGSNNNDNIDGKNNNGNIEINVNKQDIIKIHSSKSNFELNASKFVSNLGINNNVINKNLLLTSHSLTKSLNSLVINDNKIKDNNNTDNNISINKSILNGSVKSLHSSTVNNKDNKNRLLLNFPGLIKASSLGNMVSNNNGNNNLCKNTSANKISSSVSSSKSTLTNLKNSNSPLVTTSAALSANTASSTKTDKKSSLLPTSFSKPPSTLSLSSTNKSRLSKQTSSSSPPSKQPTSLPLPPSNKTSSSPNQASSPPSCTQHSTTPTTRTSASNVPSSLTNSLSVGDLNPMDKPSHRSNRDSPDGKGSHNFSLHAHISNTGICKEHGKPYSVYLITVEEIYPHTHAHQDTQDHKWFIYRRFSDFYNLHSTLLSRYNNINSLILPNRRPFDNMNKEFLERRRVGLNMYLQTLVKLAPLNSYPGLFELVHAFLQPQWERGKSDLSRKVDYFVNPFRSSVRSVGNMVKAVPNSLFDNMVKVRNIPGNMIGGVGRMLSVKTTETQPQKNLKVGASLDIEVSEDNIPLHIMLLLMDEVFDLKNRNQWLRRRIVALLQQLVKTMFGDSINRKIVECVVAYTSSEAFAGYLRLLKESVWPNGRRAPAAQERTHSDKMRRRVVCKSKLLGNVSDEFKHIINSDTTRQGVTLVFDLFQEVNLNKRLALVVLEGLLETLFPDNKFPETFVRLHSSLNINNNNNKNNNNNTRNKENNTNNKNNNTNNTRSKDNNSNIKNNLEKSKSFGNNNNNNNNNNNDLDNKNINNHKNLKSSYSINPAFQKS